MSDISTVKVIGGSVSGTLVYANLLHLSKGPLRIFIVNSRAHFGSGLADQSNPTDICLMLAKGKKIIGGSPIISIVK